MRYLLTTLAILITTITFSQLYDESGRFDINEAFKHHEYISKKYSFRDLRTNEVQEGFVVISLDSSTVEFSEEGNFYFTMPVKNIIPRSHNGRMYAIYIFENATLSVKWDTVKSEYCFEYEQGTNPQNGFRYIFFETSLNQQEE